MSGTLTLATYRRLRAEVLAGGLSPDAALTERGLADRLGVSRTPLRAALARLEREGILSRPGGGAILMREISVERLVESLDLRRMLEALAAERAAEFGPTAELRALAAEMAAFAEGAPGSPGFHDEDRAFHLALARAGRLPLLAELLEEHLAIARIGGFGPGPEAVPAIAAEHLAILAAVDRGARRAARAALERHMERGRARCLARLDPARAAGTEAVR